MKNKLDLIGFAGSSAANHFGCALGPWHLYYHPELLQLLHHEVEWQMLHYTSMQRGLLLLPQALDYSKELADKVLTLIEKKKHFCVLGGDHSCAIGTWSGVAHAYRSQGDIGLIWIDAHMDSHTPESSMTKNIHGMPLAHLLGYGHSALCEILDKKPKLKPRNVCLIGIRSYEEGELELLSNLGVKVFYMPEVEQRGIAAVLKEAHEWVASETCGYGMSIDLDAFDPTDAPGVGCPEPNGINAQEFLTALMHGSYQKRLLGVEIAEYNPLLDVNDKTAHLIVDLINVLFHA